MTPLIATHAFAALTSLLLGGWQLFASHKGDSQHRIVGRIWVALMLYVSVSSFLIRELRPGHFSFLHILSVVTIVSVTMGVVAAVRGDIAGHRGNMTGSWIGLCFAFAFAVAIPVRAIPQFVLTDPWQAALAAATVVATSAVVIGLGRVVGRRVPASVA